MDDEVVVDFYVAVPEIMGELNPLRKKLKKRFPKATRSKKECFFSQCYQQLFILSFVKYKAAAVCRPNVMPDTTFEIDVARICRFYFLFGIDILGVQISYTLLEHNTC
jgi:hypothetical protein